LESTEGMENPFRNRGDLGLDRMFETRSEAWERVGLAVSTSHRAIRKARRQALIFLPLLIGVLVVYGNRQQLLGIKCVPHGSGSRCTHSPWETPLQIATVIALLILGWSFARDVGRAAAPTIFRRLDPATAGTVGFLIRLITIVITIVIAFSIAGADPQTLLATTAFTAVVFGLAAQQTLGNLIAGLVLISARPFRVGERVRLQAGAMAGQIEGVVSSLGLLYTSLVIGGEDKVMVPNNVVLAAAVMPLKEPESVDVKVRLSSNVRPSHVQSLLNDQVTTPTRSKPRVLLEQIDGEDVVVRVRATPERTEDGAKLADEIIVALAAVTGDHALASE
jgi:small conductance mechanosensitive channel